MDHVVFPSSLSSIRVIMIISNRLCRDETDVNARTTK